MAAVNSTAALKPPARARAMARRWDVLISGACVAAIMVVIASPLLLQAEPARREPVETVRRPVAAATSASGAGFAVPTNDPLLTSEKVYQILVDQAPPASVRSVPPPRPAIEPASPVRSETAARPVETQAPVALAAPLIQKADLGASRNGGAAHPEPAGYMGVWSANLRSCSGIGQSGLLTAIDGNGAWAGETRCAFKKMRKTNEGWSVEARCSSEREAWVSKIRLKVAGNKLTWISQRGSQTYVRCERRMQTAHL